MPPAVGSFFLLYFISQRLPQSLEKRRMKPFLEVETKFVMLFPREEFRIVLD